MILNHFRNHKKLNKMNFQERKKRIIARGEFSDHAHVIVGDANVETKGGEVYVTIGDGGASIKHLLESAWMDGKEQWTNEHTDIDLSDMPCQIRHGDIMLKKVGERKYKYIQQQVFDPLTQRIEDARD
jgi:hypothetical protein